MESGEFLESNQQSWESPKEVLFGPKSQHFIFYSILCVLLKSEALFTFFVYWLRVLQFTSGTVGLPNYNTLSHLWLLKPLFSLIIDKVDVPISQRYTSSHMESSTHPEGAGGSDQNSPFVQYSSYSILSNVTNYRVLVLIVSEYLIAFSSLALYALHKLNCFHTLFTKVLVYTLGLSLVCTSSYAEGLFSRYVRNGPEESYVKYVSIRLSMSSLYALTTLGCILLPVFFYKAPLGKFFQINIFFPLFLTFNALFVSWVVSRPVLDEAEDDYEPEYSGRVATLRRYTSFSSLFSRHRRDAASTQKLQATYTDSFSIKFLGALMLLMFVSMRLKNDLFNTYRHTKVDNYLLVLLTQFFKVLISLLIFKFTGTESLESLCISVFGVSLLLLFPLNSKTRLFCEKIGVMGRIELVFLGFMLSLMQQIILTYSLTMCLYLTPRGYESSILSIPSFVVHATHLCLRQNAIEYLDLSARQKAFIHYSSFLFFSICYFILWTNSSQIHQRTSNGEREQVGNVESPEPPLQE